MLSYEEIKKLCSDHKKEFIIAGCFVLVFLVGFGTGRYDKEVQKSKARSQKYNNINLVSQQKTEPVNGDDANAGQVAGEATGDKTKTDGKCPIKGNISTSGMIYHMPGGASYEKTNPEKCFNTEAEARAAGFRKASR